MKAAVYERGSDVNTRSAPSPSGLHPAGSSWQVGSVKTPGAGTYLIDATVTGNVNGGTGQLGCYVAGENPTASPSLRSSTPLGYSTDNKGDATMVGRIIASPGWSHIAIICFGSGGSWTTSNVALTATLAQSATLSKGVKRDTRLGTVKPSGTPRNHFVRRARSAR